MTEQADSPLVRETIVTRLEREIQQLYTNVAAEFGPNTEEAKSALKNLDQAQQIVVEEAGQLDEALYQVALVKAMITRKQEVKRWSATWGLLLVGYALIWLAIFVAGFFFQKQVSTSLGQTGEAVNAIRAAWFSALAGGVGGALNILYDLFGQVVIRKAFDRQYIMYYIVKPVMGFFLGAVAYFIIQAGFLFFDITVGGYVENQAELIASVVTGLQVVVALLVGFRQRFALEMIDKIVQRASPKTE